MDTLINVVSQYWGIGVAFVLGVAYILTHRQTALAYARRKAVTLMLAVEKRAETLVLADGPSKFAWVVSNGYDLLPAVVRIIISKPAFKLIVQELFDAAVAFADGHAVQTPAVTPIQDVSQAQK